MNEEQLLGFDTYAVHGADGSDKETGAVNTPVYLTSTFQQDAVGQNRGYEYARTSNPSRASLERHLALLERARHGYCFSSGLAAEDALLRLLSPGDRLLMQTDSYGGSYRLARSVHEPAGLRVETGDFADLERLLGEETRMVWIESPTNPLLGLVDLAEAAGIAHRRGATVVVDNTFATPWIQQPLALGADVVVHSTTKYLGGHSDVVGGFVATNDEAIGARLAFLQNAVGGVPGPFDCYLVQRGVKTLPVRMARHCDSALAIVAVLRSHPAVERVFHPSLPEHPGHDIAKRQMRAYGGMVSFTLRGGVEAALAVCQRTKVFTLAESLGAVESLIEHPARMTHLSTAGTTNEVPANLVRLSVGLESVEDLIADLIEALRGL